MTTKTLYPTQQKLLDILKKNIDDPLTIRDLQERLKVSSTSVVAHHLLQLEKKGYLWRDPSDSRNYTIVKDGPEKSVAYLPLYGLAHCGPHGSILDGTPVDRIPVSTRLLGFPHSEGFLVKAKGDSMLPKIANGDLVITRRAKIAASGDVVVCVNNEEALIKKIRKDKQDIILLSLNDNFEPFLASADFRVEGIVRSILSYAI